MLFTSLTLFIFLLLVFFSYWFVFNRKVKSQNLFLLASSYIFYGYWDWRFLALLVVISLSNYIIGINIDKNCHRPSRKSYLILGLAINTGTLVLFKYFNFFIEGFVTLFSLFGVTLNQLTLHIILPIGISFYIFLSISYIIEIYQGRFKAVKNLVDVLLSISFFPIILAGPIQRPISLIPQLQNKRTFSYAQATDGLKQILWGIFMKIVIADKCAITVNSIFADFSMYSGSTLIMGLFLFSIQIYADFAGYSNIAIGVGKLLGFEIMRNFGYPYFARDIREFWQRWNISLTTWFRDYVFLPIAFSISGSVKSGHFSLIKTELFIYIVGVGITWLLTGLWHGANYTFIIWGLYHGVFLIINHIAAKPRKRFFKRLGIHRNNIFLTIIDSLITFSIIMVSWIFFRVNNIADALNYISEIFSVSSFTIPEIRPKSTIILIILFLFTEWFGRTREYPIAYFAAKGSRILRWGLYYCIIFTILYFGGEKQEFIYFQF